MKIGPSASFLLSFLFLPAALTAQTPGSVVVNVASANVRAGPSTSATVIRSFPSGTTFEVAGVEGEWYEIALDDPASPGPRRAFISQSVVTFIAAPPPPPPAPEPESASAPPPPPPPPSPPQVNSDDARGRRLGVRLGGASSTLALTGVPTDELRNVSRLTAFSVGGFLRMPGPLDGSWQGELLYTRKGVSSGADPGGFDETGTQLRLSYLEIVGLFHRRFPVQSVFTPYVIAGPWFGLLGGCALVSGSDSYECDDDEWTGTDLGVAFGGGAEYPLGNLDLLVELRYSAGLQAAYRETDRDCVGGVCTGKNRSWTFFLGASMPF